MHFQEYLRLVDHFKDPDEPRSEIQIKNKKPETEEQKVKKISEALKKAYLDFMPLILEVGKVKMEFFDMLRSIIIESYITSNLYEFKKKKTTSGHMNNFLKWHKSLNINSLVKMNDFNRDNV